MGINECTEMELLLQNSQYPCVSGTIPAVGGAGTNSSAANQVAITQTFSVLNKLYQAFLEVFWLGHNRVHHTSKLDMSTGGPNNC